MPAGAGGPIETKLPYQRVRPKKGRIMPKMKSNSGAKKRFTTTGTGRLRRKNAFKSHILTKKSPKRKRNLRGTTLVDPVDEPRMRKMING